MFIVVIPEAAVGKCISVVFIFLIGSYIKIQRLGP
jgi:hypothetical protein